MNLEVLCSELNLEQAICSQYCTTNLTSCVNDMVLYCFTPPSGQSAANMPIGTSLICQEFVQNYIQQNGPLAQFDQGLNSYCSTKYQGFGDLFDSNNQTDQELCACHMPAAQYAAFEQQLTQLYPGFQNLGVVDECLLPQCASSQYKSTVTTAKCNLPQCINIASFNNNGTFNQSSVTINQSSNCANIVGGNVPSGKWRRKFQLDLGLDCSCCCSWTYCFTSYYCYYCHDCS